MGEPLRVKGVHRDVSRPCAIVTFNRPLSSDELLALHRLLVHYVNHKPTVPVVAVGGGEV